MAQHNRPHEPKQLTLLVERVEAGGLLVRTPSCPGWAHHCPSPAELARAVEAAYVEATVAAYARLRGVLYDLAETEETIPPSAYAVGSRHPAEPEPDADPADEVATRRRRSKKHPKTHAPEDWVELEGGGMLSPTGRRYGAHTAVVARVASARQALT